MKRKIVIVKSIGEDYTKTLETHCAEWELENGYVQITEEKEVEFVVRYPETILKESLEALEKEVQNVNAKANLRLTELEEKKQKLLALPDLTGEQQ